MRTGSGRFALLSVLCAATLLAAAGYVGAGGERGAPSPGLPLAAVSTPQARGTGRGPQARPCAAGDCSSAVAVDCNQVVEWTNDVTNQWNDYNCLDKTVFAGVPYPEDLYSLTIDVTGLDFGLSIPSAKEGMDNLGVVLDQCDSDHCIAASHVKQNSIYQHAIVPDAPPGDYTLVLDSPNMAGFGDAIVACGRHDTGWCSQVVSETLTCGQYTIHGNTQAGSDQVIYYGNYQGFPIRYLFDGPEAVYRVVLTETRLVSLTLHYAGNPAMDYYNYLSFFLLGADCDQRSPLLFGGWAGEGAEDTCSNWRWLPGGVYYLVVDGMHMPVSGDAFRLDVNCPPPVNVYLPTVQRH